MREDFSVLMSIYHKESLSHFKDCLQSIWHQQTLRPSQVVLVVDGELSQNLYDEINSFKSEVGDKLDVLQLDQNYGLGHALCEGLKLCKYDWVARMDTDDLAVPHRFQRQLSYIKTEGLDLLGGWVSEFEGTIDRVLAIRKVPTTSAEIYEFAKSRCPFNHPTVMFRRQAVLDAGSYRTFHGFEDYDLWTRMMANNSKLGNLPEILLHFRSGSKMLQRRRGVEYAKNEFKFQNALLERGFISRTGWFLNTVTRCSVRLFPESVVGVVYKWIRR